MAKNQTPWTGIANPHRLSQKIERQQRMEGFWSKFFSENTKKYQGIEVPPVGNVREPSFGPSIIQAWEDLASNGGDHIDIPVKGRYTEPGKVGDAEIQGTGEGIKFGYRNLVINQHMKAGDFVRGTARQRLNNSMEQAANDVANNLKDWWVEMQDGNIQHAFLTGYDANLTDLRGLEGSINMATPFSPANFFVAGSGQVGYDAGRPGTIGFEESVTGAVNAMMSKSPTLVGFTAKRCAYIRNQARRVGIRPLKTPYGEFIVCVAKDSQLAQLYQDPEYINLLTHAIQKDMMGNPLFADADAICHGLLIYRDNNHFGIRTDADNKVVAFTSSTLGMPYYGPTGFWISELGQGDTDTNECALVYVLGAQAMNKAFGRDRFKMTLEEWGHESRKEMALHAYQSYVRSDVFDSDDYYGLGSGAFLQNTSFMVFATRSPYDFEA